MNYWMVIRDSIKGQHRSLNRWSETPVMAVTSTVERLEALINNDTIGAIQQSVDDLASLLSETKQLVTEVKPRVMSVLDSADQLTRHCAKSGAVHG